MCVADSAPLEDTFKDTFQKVFMVISTLKQLFFFSILKYQFQSFSDGT